MKNWFIYDVEYRYNRFIGVRIDKIAKYWIAKEMALQFIMDNLTELGWTKNAQDFLIETINNNDYIKDYVGDYYKYLANFFKKEWFR